MLKPPTPCRMCGRAVKRSGLCADHLKQVRAGYGTRGHKEQFRLPVLARAGYKCVLCGEPANIADHYPHSRRELVAAGLNPDDPQYGRALCKRCHDTSTGSRRK
jgi:5-methylcytosine-specific restriction enzyme A